MKFKIPLRKKEKENEVERVKRKKGYNPEFLASIQPQGGISFPELFVKKGDGFETIIHVYGYPTQVDKFWLHGVANMQDTIVTIDYATEPKSVAISTLNNSITEQYNRMYTDKESSSQLEAVSDLDSLRNMFDQISRNGEVIKMVHVRIYVHARTTVELERKVKDVLEDLEGQSFQGAVFLNETEYEWKSLFLPYKEQQELLNKREGKHMSALTCGAAFPFNFSELRDPNGTYYGTTFTGGSVIFDYFHKDKRRRYYNGAIVGTMGAGKSTLLKKIMLDNVVRGNKIRGFDVTGEFEELVADLDGKLISMDGTQGILNPLQVLRTDESEEQSFMIHLSKLSKFYRFLAPSASDEIINEFEKVLRGLYEVKGLIGKMESGGITNLSPAEYPIFTDLLNHIRNELYSDYDLKKIRTELSNGRVARLESIELTIENLVVNYGSLFDGHSSIENLNSEQIVFYSLRNLTSLKKEVFNAQMFNLLMLNWDNMLQNGKPQKEAYENGQLCFEDVIRFLVIMDESHRFINTENLLAVRELTSYSREARKYFGGLLFASQSIRDYVPDGSSDEAVAEIKKLFELTQYKFIMQQDSNALETMRKIFEGQLSESELEAIPFLEQGETVLAINSFRNIMFHVDADEEELKLFKGGA